MKGLITYEFNGKEVRITTKNGEPWWFAKDVCDILGLKDVSMSLQKLEDDEKLIQKLFVLGQHRQFWLINEPGLYSLILRSNKPAAKKFKRWITHDVLPEIRKTGGYSINEKKEIEELKKELKSEINELHKEMTAYFVRMDYEKIPLSSPKKAKKEKSTTMRVPVYYLKLIKKKARKENRSISSVSEEVFRKMETDSWFK